MPHRTPFVRLTLLVLGFTCGCAGGGGDAPPDAALADGGVDAAAGDAGDAGDAGTFPDGAAPVDGGSTLDTGVVGSDASMDAGAPAPTITSFTGPASACTGASLDLASDFANGAGVITPGDLAVASGAATTSVTLAATTTFTLTVTNPVTNAVATAQATVVASPSPDASITAPAAVALQQKALVASVPMQAGASYAWSVLSGNATITSSTSASQVAFEVGGAGTEVVLQAVVTNAQGCASTGLVHVPIPCGAPELVSAAAVPDNLGTRSFDATAASTWATVLAHDDDPANASAPVFDLRVGWNAGAGFAAPVGSPTTLNAPGFRVFETKVVTDDAGDAVFAWTETSDLATFTVRLRAYRAATNTWSAAHTVGTVFSQVVPVSLGIEHASGVALVGFTTGPWNAQIPHVRSYTVATDTLGTDLALESATTNDFPPETMNLALAVDDTLSGYAVWTERDASTGVVTILGVHLTNGVLAPAMGGGYVIETLVQGATTSTTDLLNQYGTSAGSPNRQLRVIATSPGGNAALVWRVYNGLSSAANKGLVYARRYVSGTWGAPEVVAATPTAAWNAMEWAVDDAGRVVVVLSGASNYGVTSAAVGAAFAPVTTLASGSGSRLPYVAMDPASGRAVATYTEWVDGRLSLRAVPYDALTGTLGPRFTVDDAREGVSESGRVALAADGAATIVFTQRLGSPPAGSTSNDASRVYATRCVLPP